MDKERYSRSRGAVWRRLAVGVGLTALTLGMATVPAAAAPAGSGPAVAPLGVIAIPAKRIPSSGLHIPPHVFGDADFAGHGPDVTASARLSFAGTHVQVTLCVRARETKQDFTTADGCAEYTLHDTAQGDCVQNVSHGSSDRLVYRDTDHSSDRFDGQTPGSFVETWDVVGDTRGNEAGSKTGAFILTRQLTLTIVPC